MVDYVLDTNRHFNSFCKKRLNLGHHSILTGTTRVSDRQKIYEFHYDIESSIIILWIIDPRKLKSYIQIQQSLYRAILLRFAYRIVNKTTNFYDKIFSFV